MRRVLPILVAAAALLAGAGAGDAPARGAAAKPLLGIAGNADRFRSQTGQDSQIRSVFLGWGQGQTWGTPLASLLSTLTPLPMIHIGTAANARLTRAAITPAQIAQGRGDAYLAAINAAIAAYGGQVYVRFLAEMNNPKSLYAPTDTRGRSRGPSHSPAAYRAAFRRAYILLHGGSAGQVDAKLRAAGLPPAGRALAALPHPTLVVIWNPLAGIERGARPADEFYPGDAYVDMVGNDMYASRHGVASYDANERLYRAHPRKPYSLPEWGLEGIDDPTFIARVCAFVKKATRLRLAAYYEARPGSKFDLADKPKGRGEYRRCITPLGGKAATQPTLPKGPPTAAQLALTADPADGDAPLEVTFSTRVSLGRPPARWEVAFGDGQVRSGTGPPPAELTHTYERDGIYTATLLVYLAPPFTGTAVRFVTQARVTVGGAAAEPLRLLADPVSGRAPLAVSFRTVVNLPQPVVRWELVHGDGSARSGEGAPPRFLGYTYKQKGTYRAVLIVYLQPPFQGTLVRLLTYVDVRAT